MLTLSRSVGDLVLLTWTPEGTDAQLANGLAEIADAAAGRGAAVLGQRVFTAADAAGEAAATWRDAAAGSGLDGPPPTVIGNAACCRGAVAGIHATAVVGGVGGFIERDGEIVGRTLRGRDADYLALADPARVLRRATDADPATETRRTLALAAELIDVAGWSFADVRRTWFFLRGILDWYDAFNDCRNRFFAEIGLDLEDADRSIPASTGIEGAGPNGAWCTLDLLAVRPTSPGALAARRLVNPRQNEAPEYGSAFARGLQLDVGDARQLWISGTAAIDRAGRSIRPDDPAGQVAATLDNVAALLGGAGAGVGDICQATAFVKRPDDLRLVERALDEAGLGDLHAVRTIADVCRAELLFELDATAIVARR